MNEKTFHSARRESLRKLAVAGAVGAGAYAGLIRAALAANPRQGIRELQGAVEIDGQPARLGQKVLPGQSVTTGPDGRAVFVIGKDAFLQHADSEFRIEHGAATAVLRYVTGRILSVFGKGRKRLETPTATIGIRGTGCYIEAAQEQTYFCLCYGEADVTPNGDPAQRETVRTQHHDYPLTIDAGPGPTMMAKAAVVNHTDDELTMLEALTGRKPPFHGKDYRYDY
ncbi:MAG TPA: hypothetical protein VEC06_00400 [Paucimonas sp.]|nr:hypothetical protein [Paucimonas sp.]